MKSAERSECFSTAAIRRALLWPRRQTLLEVLLDVLNAA